MATLDPLDTIIANRILGMPEFKQMIQGMVAEEVRLQIASLHLEKNYYTPEELAKKYKVTVKTIYNHIDLGLLKADMVGRNLRISCEAEKNYLR